MSEVYSLWAIEGDETIAEVLSFAKADYGVVIAKNIDLFRELKLRLLNGTHTLSSGIAFLSGLSTVKQAMDDDVMSNYIGTVMRKEIAPAIPCEADPAEADAFAVKVLDRFRNPGIEHLWLSITMQYSSKMQMRIVPVLLRYYKLFTTVPQQMALGFAAYILFMKAVKEKDGNYFGMRNNDYYPIKDDRAAYFYEKWKTVKPESIARSVLQDMNLWGQDLSILPGFADLVQEKTDEINERGMASVLQSPASQKIPV
jgi:tagaturonate reductase